MCEIFSPLKLHNKLLLWFNLHSIKIIENIFQKLTLPCIKLTVIVICKEIRFRLKFNFIYCKLCGNIKMVVVSGI